MALKDQKFIRASDVAKRWGVSTAFVRSLYDSGVLSGFSARGKDKYTAITLINVNSMLRYERRREGL